MSERQFLRMDNWVMIRSLATQAAYVPLGGCGMWVLIYLRSAEYGSDVAFRCSENCCRNNHCLLLTA